MSAPKQGVVASISALGMGALDTQDFLGWTSWRSTGAWSSFGLGTGTVRTPHMHAPYPPQPMVSLATAYS